MMTGPFFLYQPYPIIEQFAMGPVFITGGAGFIGANLVHHLLAHSSAPLVVIDKMTYAANPLTLETWADNPRVTFVRVDIGDAGAMADLFAAQRPSVLYNLAAETHVDRSIDSPEPFIRTNIVGTSVLLDVARRHWVALGSEDREAFRFLHISTDEVYGSLGDTGRFSESTPYAPNSPYAASKAAADHLVRAYFHTYGLPTFITNCSNNYGPFQHPEKLIPLTILNALEGRRLPVYGDGGNVRDWLHVEDHCAGLVSVMQRGRPGEHYNLGGENEQNNLTVVDMICEVLEELRPVNTNQAMRAAGVARYADLKTFVTDRPGHDRRYAIDPAKAVRELAWHPRRPFRQGLAETVQWYLTHRDWYDAGRIGYDRRRLGLGTINA
jgi:dTDP-glucose 4,6-dehydratase